ncbi:MAG: transposase [Nitrososphaerota archaeon]|nr:transposase [Nitrososphaerota archaeon]MDG7024366.1 transposase [Nitrososphaerota archaeon]
MSKVVKSISFRYKPTVQTKEALLTFREMVNRAIRICTDEGIRGRFALRNRIYKDFRELYGVAACFPYSVAEVAWSIVRKNRKWNRRPYASRLMAKVDAYNYSLNYAIISIPFKAGERILIPLEYGDYQRSFLMDETLKRGSVTMTESTIVIAFTKEVGSVEPKRRVGYDLNERSIVGSDGSRMNFSEVSRLHAEYGVRRSEFHQRRSSDRRLGQKSPGSRREKERVKQFLHQKAKEIVGKAKANEEGIVLERLKGIRYAHKRGNGEGKDKRRRMALWPFRQLQSYIEYKARWEGVPIEYVSAAWTSQTCHLCQFVNRTLKPTEREWRCPNCGAILDRDLNAAINIERRGKLPCLGEVRPGAQGTDEAVEGNPQQPTAILQAEALKLVNPD